MFVPLGRSPTRSPKTKKLKATSAATAAAAGDMDASNSTSSETKKEQGARLLLVEEAKKKAKKVDTNTQLKKKKKKVKKSGGILPKSKASTCSTSAATAAAGKKKGERESDGLLAYASFTSKKTCEFSSISISYIVCILCHDISHILFLCLKLYNSGNKEVVGTCLHSRQCKVFLEVIQRGGKYRTYELHELKVLTKG